MKIVTVATEGVWLDVHLPRWVRYIHKNVPDAELYLYYAGTETPRAAILGEFAQVKYSRADVIGREWFNSVRMGATKDFDVDSILYLDCDADVLSDITQLSQTGADARIGAVLSPLMHTEWGDVCGRLGWGPPQKEWNNGLLWLRQDYTEQYAKAWKAVTDSGVIRPRIHGTLAFNVMLHNLPAGELATVPPEYGVIWHDVGMLGSAKIVQYCNDMGQQKRVELETIWIASKM